MNAWHKRAIVLSALALTLFWTTCTPSLPAMGEPAARPAQQAPVSAQGVAYYVRPDGGSPAQCTGRADAPYPGGGTGQACAWDHPFRALPPGGIPRIAGGDTLIVAQGAYMMGYGAPGAGDCEAEGAYDCHMPPIPGGPDVAQPTRILGAGWDAGCPSPPELWGSERAWTVVNLQGSSHVEVACFEITDHSSCVESHAQDRGGSEWTCERDDPPYGPWADTGLSAADSEDVTLRHLDIHGLAGAGVRAGRLADWTVEDVRIAANGWVGWEGDIDGEDANAGTMTFRRWTVEWNGCAETWPGGAPVGCWAQSAGGYGDGVGTGHTGGRWIIEDAAFLYNTSDGLDLLYATEAGASVEIRRTVARGNAGDQIKTAGPTLIENVVAASQCAFFEGKPFTYDVDPCRAGGSAVALTLRTGNEATIVHATITGQGDCLLIAECQGGYACDGSEAVWLRNSIFLGHAEYGSGGDTTCLAWTDMDPGLFELVRVLVDGVKNGPDPCPGDSLCGVSPGLADETIEGFDAHLRPGSPAIDAGTAAGAPAEDLERRPRDARPDLGAYEWIDLSAWLYLPAVLRFQADRVGGGLGIGDGWSCALDRSLGNTPPCSDARGLRCGGIQ
jgi:hypothetical protein